MKVEEFDYSVDGTVYHGYMAYDEVDSGKKLPGVLVAHAWRGQDEFARDKAKALARLGYVGFAIDLYGDGQSAESDAEAAALMKPLFIERKELRKRVVGAYKVLQDHAAVDEHKIGAIGFCFGGLAAIELLRSGVDLRGGVVSFHGVLGSHLGALRAELEPSNLPLNGALLLLHGYKDPLVSLEDLENIQKEFTDANVDWQLHIYGRASHAFTNPDAHDEGSGLIYNAGAERRSLKAMENFFAEQFS
jgi:dienelactone hydrolase